MLTKATAKVETDADLQMKFYDYFAALNASGSVSASGIVRDVFDDIGIPTEFSFGTGEPLYSDCGFVFYERQSINVADGRLE
ncbi:hypothetical protein [uncultured Sulfitobacter sp.]|uniref:hypothetical protein n=1 Tax=uncultured Sulfitobacter sp. TaxID=191468 RepID=UPI0026117D88|nr:hypothetical protein [uncultured Sulfitobacter sp.]